MKKKRDVPKPSELNAAQKALIYTVMFDHGIIPLENPVHNMNVPASQLSQSERSTAKRKFRKLWRKCMNIKIKNFVSNKNEADVPLHFREKYLKERLGVGKYNPSKVEKLTRKKMVLATLWNKEILPKLKNIENMSLF